jgi:hypothetical protein
MSEVREEAHSAQPVGCVLRHFLPARILHTIDPIREDARAITGALQNSRLVRPTALTARPWRTRELVLSGDVLEVLREVLSGEGIDLDEAFAAQRQQASLFESGDAAIPLGLWQEVLRSLSREQRLRAQQALQDAENLLERIEAALRDNGVLAVC